MTCRLALPLLVALCAVLAGCGGGATHTTTSAGGGALFMQACGPCHTLTGHNDPRHQGGDLLHFHPSRAQLRQFASEMPVRRPLSRAQLDAVVRFVMAMEAGRS